MSLILTVPCKPGFVFENLPARCEQAMEFRWSVLAFNVTFVVMCIREASTTLVAKNFHGMGRSFMLSKATFGIKAFGTFVALIGFTLQTLMQQISVISCKIG